MYSLPKPFILKNTFIDEINVFLNEISLRRTKSCINFTIFENNYEFNKNDSSNISDISDTIDTINTIDFEETIDLINQTSIQLSENTINENIIDKDKLIESIDINSDKSSESPEQINVIDAIDIIQKNNSNNNTNKKKKSKNNKNKKQNQVQNKLSESEIIKIKNHNNLISIIYSEFLFLIKNNYNDFDNFKKYIIEFITENLNPKIKNDKIKIDLKIKSVHKKIDNLIKDFKEKIFTYFDNNIGNNIDEILKNKIYNISIIIPIHLSYYDKNTDVTFILDRNFNFIKNLDYSKFYIN